MLHLLFKMFNRKLTPQLWPALMPGIFVLRAWEARKAAALTIGATTATKHRLAGEYKGRIL
jgi:hypothetical protein